MKIFKLKTSSIDELIDVLTLAKQEKGIHGGTEVCICDTHCNNTSPLSELQISKYGADFIVFYMK